MEHEKKCYDPVWERHLEVMSAKIPDDDPWVGKGLMELLVAYHTLRDTPEGIPIRLAQEVKKQVYALPKYGTPEYVRMYEEGRLTEAMMAAQMVADFL